MARHGQRKQAVLESLDYLWLLVAHSPSFPRQDTVRRGGAYPDDLRHERRGRCRLVVGWAVAIFSTA